MAGLYVDTSVLGRVLLAEPDAPAVLGALRGYEEHVSSHLLRVELRRLGLRHGVLDQADQLLTGIALLPVDAALATAETMPPPTVATLDAIHLATAVGLAAGRHIEAVITYDERLAEGCRHHGVDVIAPA